MIKTMFDNLNEFSAGDFATVYKNIFDSGILCPFGETILNTTALKVTNSSGNASIGNGSALIKGHIITIKDEIVTLSTDGTYKIVLEWSAASDGSQLKALSGSATLEQKDTLYQILLATVIKSGTSLTITDGRSFINRMTDNQAIPLQTALQTGWTKVDVALTLAGIDSTTGKSYFSAPSSIASVLQFGTKVKFTQDSTVKYATIKSITVSGETATIYFDSDVEITSNTITNLCCNNSGVPIGFPSGINRDYLLEYGSNANGEYYKFADGRLECRIRKIVTDQAIATAYGNNFLGYRMWTFPMAFINTNNLIVTQGEVKSGTGAGWSGGVSALTASNCQLNFFDAYQRATGTSFVFSAIAIGRWK